MSKINQVTFEHNDNYVIYDDCDSMTDYFHMYSGSLKRIIEAIKERGGDKIVCVVCNNDETIPGLKRAKRIAKNCGYDLEDTSCDKTTNGCFGPVTRFNYEYTLTKRVDN